MNSSEYTICNLDNQTYVTHFGGHHGESGSVYSGGGGGGGGGFSGLNEAGPYPYHPSPTLHHASAHNGVPSLPVDISPHGQGPTCSPLSGYESGLGAQPTYTAAYQGQFAPYYGAHGAGLMPNGCVTPDLPGSPAYPAAYPGDPLGYPPGSLMHQQCAHPAAYLNGHAPQQQNDSNVTTYKWMTIKRAQPKTTTPGM